MSAGARVIEARHGYAGARRALGGMGGHFGAPHYQGRPPLPQIGERVAAAERVRRVDAVLEDPGDPGLASDRWHDAGPAADGGLPRDDGLELRADDRLVHETLPDREPPAGVENGQPRRGAG